MLSRGAADETSRDVASSAIELSGPRRRYILLARLAERRELFPSLKSVTSNELQAGGCALECCLARLVIAALARRLKWGLDAGRVIASTGDCCLGPEVRTRRSLITGLRAAAAALMPKGGVTLGGCPRGRAARRSGRAGSVRCVPRWARSLGLEIGLADAVAETGAARCLGGG